MGIGDDIIATGMARGAASRGKRIAFGDGKRIIWGPHSSMIFANNPNIAAPGSQGSDLEWIPYYKGHRIYNSAGIDRWIWNYGFKVSPGELFLTPEEKNLSVPDNLVMIEPNVPNKACAPNKQWPIDRFHEVTDALIKMGLSVRQFNYGRPNIVAPGIKTNTFRQAAGLLKRSLFAILPEGGLHHAAAALGVPAVVLFGGFVPPSVLGYDTHINLTGGSTACGLFKSCPHCAQAMNAITTDEVLVASKALLCR